MNCDAVRNLILALPDPRELTPALREHTRGCAACAGFARRAAQLETVLAALPVPAAPVGKKADLLDDLTRPEPLILPMPAPAQRPGAAERAARFLRRNAGAVAGLAAAALVAVGGFWMAVRPKPLPEEVAKVHKHPLLEKMVARDVQLARADTAAKKLEVLGGMAEELAGETRGMARLAPGAELRQMAGWYEKVVRDGLVPQSAKLPPHVPAATKAELLNGLAAKLDADAAAADRLTGEAPQDAHPALKRVADAARDGGNKLRAAARGGN
jgi:hypothetical protein